MQNEPLITSPDRDPLIQLGQGHEAKVIAAIGFLSAASFLLMSVGIPMPGAPYLVYEPSDVPALVASFTMGPLAGATVVGVRNLLRMMVHPQLFGLLINLFASGLFVALAGAGYRRWRTRHGAVLALSLATAVQAIALVALNALLLPYYMGLSGPGLTRMLIVTVLPFNLLKGIANSALVYFLYKRISGFFPRV